MLIGWNEMKMDGKRTLIQSSIQTHTLTKRERENSPNDIRIPIKVDVRRHTHLDLCYHLANERAISESNFNV